MANQENKYCRQTIKDLVNSATKSEELQFKDEEARKVWQDIVEVNSGDDYGACVIRSAECWAKLMQYIMTKHEGATVAEIASEALYATDIDGGFMYSCVVNVLSQVWKHGEDLRKWHNKEYDYEGDGVVNPAVLA